MKNLITLLTISIILIVVSGCAGIQYGRGVSYLKQQRYSEAIDSFNAVLEKNQEYPKAHTQLGIAYYKSELYKQAISELKTAKELRSNDKRARLFLGMSYLRYGKIDDTIIEWSSYLKMFPYDNMSEQLRNGIAVLESSEILPETVDLITGNIETIIAQEDRIRDTIYYYRVRNFGHRYRFSHFHGYYPCD
ncbi:MAG: tetratricopeptide repeat protein [Candidatus Scalinduaceae bacterium]